MNKKIEECDFFVITDGVSYGIEGKIVEIVGYLWKSDTGWRLTECSGCAAPIKEFVDRYAEEGKEFLNEMLQGAKQYEKELTDKEAELVFSSYPGNKTNPFRYWEVREDTAYGDYRHLNSKRILKGTRLGDFEIVDDRAYPVGIRSTHYILPKCNMSDEELDSFFGNIEAQERLQ
jgi:hypothetical protein